MKALILVVSLGLGLAIQSSATEAKLKKTFPTAKAHAKPHATVVKKNASVDKGHLSTDVNFGDSVLRGEYQAPGEALAKVENEKGLRDLIGVRKNFKDRLAISSDQE